MEISLRLIHNFIINILHFFASLSVKFYFFIINISFVFGYY